MDKPKIFAAVEKAIQKGQTDKAIEGLEQILRADPVDLKALSKVADLYLKESSFDKAVEALKRIGAVYAKDGFYSKAVAIYKRILKIDKLSNPISLIEIHEQLASLYGHLGLVSDAMGHFSIVVDHHDKAGDQAALLETLKKVSELDPGNVETQLKLAELFIAQNREPEAIELLDSLVENLESKESLPELIRVNERYFDLFPMNTGRLKSLVSIFLEANEPKRALTKIQIAFRADPRNQEVLELLSATFLALHQPEKSKAVDIELLKLYRQNGDTELANAVESRIKGRPLVERPETPAGSAPQAIIEEPQDPVESLVKALPLTPEERKILSECDVYFKYGLVEKAYEVLKNRLSQFPQSLVLRWKLKNASHNLKKTDETAHLLAEIILLAKSQNLGIWANLASTELRAIDPEHSALDGFEAPKEKESSSVVAKSGKAEEDEFSFKDFESSEVSIVIDDDLGDDNSEFSEISFQDLNDEKPAKVKNIISKSKEPEEQTLELVEDVSLEEDSAPLELHHDSEVLELSSSDEGREGSVDQAEASEPSFVLEEDAEPQDILSEADFSFDELQKLDSSLVSQAPSAAKVSQDAKEKVDAVDEAFGEIDNKEVLSDPEFEIKQGLEEVEFFRSQGLDSEADNLIKSLKERFPDYKKWPTALSAKSSSSKVKENDSKLVKKSLNIETLGRNVKMSVQDDQREEASDDFFDLAAEIRSELDKPVEGSAPAEIKDVFSAFKKGVSATVDAQDWQTHLDLGIAYREMGLYDDALEAFRLVSNASGQKVSALYQMGLTQVAAGRLAEAKDFFDQALKEPKMLGEEKLSVSYELGEVLLKLNNKDKAKKIFQEVQKLDPEFREVKEKIKELG